jgi:hypothetical protein
MPPKKKLVVTTLKDPPPSPTFATLGDPFKAKPVEPNIPIGDAVGGSPAGWHSVEDFIRCPKEYQFRHVRNVRSPSTEMKDHFAIGVLLHAAKAHWFARKFATDEATLLEIRRLVQVEGEKQKLPVSLKAEQQALTYFNEYVTFWRIRPKPTPIACEYDIGPAPLEAGDPFFLWRTGRLDDVSAYPESGGKLAIGDLKTTGASINDCVNQYTLHGQPLLYALLWRNAKQGQAMHGPISGVVLDIVQKGYGGTASKFSRVFIPVTEHSLTWFAQGLKAQLRQVAAVEAESTVERRVTACTRMVGRGRYACEFRNLCQYGKSASGEYVTASGESLLKSGYEIWK